MRKIGLLGLALVCSMVIFTGCGGQKQGADNAETSTVEVNYDTLMKDLEESNKNVSIIDKYGKVCYEAKDIVKDGTEYSWSYYQDKDRIVSDDYYGYCIVEGNEAYGTSYEINNYFRTLFVGDSYELFLTEYKMESIYQYSENEELTSKQEKDGVIYLETKISQEPMEGYYVGYGYEQDEVECVVTEYMVDADTLEILELKAYFVVGEEKKLYNVINRNKECEEYVPDKELEDKIFGSDTRTVTVIVDAGTADEKKYSQTCGKGCAVQIYFSLEEFENKFYANKECTEVAEMDLTTDSISYLKRIEK